MIKIRLHKKKKPLACKDKNYIFPKAIAKWLEKNIDPANSTTEDLRKACIQLGLDNKIFRECVLAEILSFTSISKDFELDFTDVRKKDKYPLINEYNLNEVEHIISKEEIKKHFKSIANMNKELMRYLADCINCQYGVCLG